MWCHYNHSESWWKDAGNRRTSTYVNIKTVNDDCNNTNVFVRVLFWVYFEKQCCQENIHKTYFWSTFIHNYTQRHEEALVRHQTVILPRGLWIFEQSLLILDWDFSLSLFQVFQVAYVIIKAANAPRPGNWILERSLDGTTFSPWQYYAVSDTECLTRYNITPRRGPPTYRADDEVICTSYYSRLVPLEHGEVLCPPQSPHLRCKDSRCKSQRWPLKVDLS